MGAQIERSISKAISKLDKYEKAKKSPSGDLRSANSGGAKAKNNSDALCIYHDTMLIEEELLDQQTIDCHRNKLCTAPLNIMGGVVKVLKRSDPLWSSAGAQAALLKEVTKLVVAGVWDVKPIPRAEAIKLYPEATFSRLFDIMGLKNSELGSEATYKARIVVQGSNVRTLQ